MSEWPCLYEIAVRGKTEKHGDRVEVQLRLAGRFNVGVPIKIVWISPTLPVRSTEEDASTGSQVSNLDDLA